MYSKSKQQIYLKNPVYHTQRNMKIVFNVMSRATMKYLNSSFVRGTMLWDSLPIELQTTSNALEFTKIVRTRFKQYIDLL